MATYDANQRAARVKLQLRDKNGLWIEMGKKAHWLSKTTGKKMSGTIVGIDGLNAYVLPPLENPTHEPMPFKISLKALGMYSPKADLKDHGRPKGTSEAEKVYQDKMMQKFDENYDENQRANAEKHKKAVESGKAGKHENDAIEVDELGKEVPAEADETERDEAEVSQIVESVKEVLDSINDTDFEEAEEGITSSTTILDEDGNELTIEARKDSNGVRTIVLKDSDGNIIESYDAKRTDGAFAQEIAEKVYDTHDAAEYDEKVDLDGDGIPDEEDPAISVKREDYSETKIVPIKEDLDSMAEGDIVEQDGYTYIKGSDDGWTGYETDENGNLAVLKDEDGDVEFYDGETLADGSEFTHLTKSAQPKPQKRAPAPAPTEGIDNDNNGVADDREIDHDSDGDGIRDVDDPSGDSVVDSQQERTTPTVEEAEEVPVAEPEAPQQDTLPGLEKPRRNQERIDELNVAADELEKKAVDAGRDQEEAVATRIAKVRELQEKADEGRYASDITRAKNAIASAEKFLDKPAPAPKKAKEPTEEAPVAEAETPQPEAELEPEAQPEAGDRADYIVADIRSGLPAIEAIRKNDGTAENTLRQVSAEEYEANPAEPMFRGISSDEDLESSYQNSRLGAGGSGPGLYFSDDRSEAKRFTGAFIGGDNRVIQGKLADDAKVADGNDIRAEIEALGSEKPINSYMQDQDPTVQAAYLGYDAITFDAPSGGKYTIVVNPDKVVVPQRGSENPEAVAEIPAEEVPQAETQDEPFGEMEDAELPEAEVIEEEPAPTEPEAQPEPVQEAPEPASEPVAEEPAPATPAPAETPVAEPTAPANTGSPVSDPIGTKYTAEGDFTYTKLGKNLIVDDEDRSIRYDAKEFDEAHTNAKTGEKSYTKQLPTLAEEAGEPTPSKGKASGKELREYVNHWDQTDDNGDRYIPNLGDRLDTIRETKESVDIDLSEYHQNDSVNSLGIAYSDGRLIEIGDRIMYRAGKTHSDIKHPEFTDAYHEVEVIGFDSQGKVNMLPIDSVDYYTHDKENNPLYVSKPLDGVLARGSKKGFMHASPSKLSDYDGKRIYKSSDIPTNRPDAIRILTERETEFRGADGELLEVGEPVRFRHRDHDRTIMVKDPISGLEVPTRGPSYNKVFDGTIVSLNPSVQSAVINISKDPDVEQLITASLVYSVSGSSVDDPPTPSSYTTGKGLPELPEGFTRYLRRVFHEDDLGIENSSEPETEDEEGQDEDFDFDDYDVEPEEAEADSEEVPEAEPATAPSAVAEAESETETIPEESPESEPTDAESLPTTADPADTVVERERVKEAFGDLEELDAPRPVRKGVTKSVFKGTEDWKSEYGRFFRDTDKQEFTSDRAKARHIASEAPIGSSVITANGGRATRTSKETWDYKSRRGGLVERDISNNDFSKKLLENDADLLTNATFRAPNKTSYSSYNKESIDHAKKNVDNAIRKAGNGATISSSEGILTKDGEDWYNDRGEISGIPENYSLVSLVPASTISTMARVGQDDLESVSVAVNQGLFRKTSNGWETRDLDTVTSTITDDELQEIMLNNSSDDLVDSVFVPDSEVLSVRGNTVNQVANPTLSGVRNNPYKTPRGTVVSSTNKVNGAEVKSTLIDPDTNLWRNEVSTPDNSILRSASVGSLSKSHDHSDTVDILQPNFKLDHDTIDAFYEATAKDLEAYNDQDLDALMNLGHTPVDFSTMTMEEVVGTFQEKFGDEISVGIYNDRGEINYSDQNVLGAKKVLEGYYQIRSKYPWMQSLGGIHIDKSDRDSSALAYVRNVDMSQAGEKIDLVIQSKAADGSAGAFLEDHEEYGSHFMPASDPSRYIGHHETGHIVDGHRFTKDGEGVDVLADWVAEFLGMSLAQLEDMSYTEIMEALNRKGYTSKYGFADIYSKVPESKNPFAGVNNYGIYRMDHFEVVAEAFADVEQNGSKASPVSKFIWKKLVSEAQLRAMYFRDTGELPSLADLEDYQNQIK